VNCYSMGIGTVVPIGLQESIQTCLLVNNGVAICYKLVYFVDVTYKMLQCYSRSMLQRDFQILQK
jgi:hypothetical protein